MKRILVLSLFSCALFTACSQTRDGHRERDTNRNAGRFGYQGEETESPRKRTRVKTEEVTTVERESRSSTSTAPSEVSNTVDTLRNQTGSTPPVTRGKLPYGIPVPGKPGHVKSPYAPDAGYIDVTEFAPGQRAVDPFTEKEFLVP